jgi:putative hydrolase of HD superfamily
MSDVTARRSPVLARSVAIARLSLALGRVDRATRHEDGVRPETDTDHTVMLCLLVADLAQLPTLRDRVDVGRLLAFALVHDVVEAYAGDTVSIDLTPEQRREKAAREAEALARLRNEFGADAWIVQTIEAYERQDTIEARMVNYADKIVPKFTHALNGGCTLRALGVSMVSASEQGQRLARKSPDLPELAELFGEARDELSAALVAACDAAPGRGP